MRTVVYIAAIRAAGIDCHRWATERILEDIYAESRTCRIGERWCDGSITALTIQRVIDIGRDRRAVSPNARRAMDEGIRSRAGIWTARDPAQCFSVGCGCKHHDDYFPRSGGRYGHPQTFDSRAAG